MGGQGPGEPEGFEELQFLPSSDPGPNNALKTVEAHMLGCSEHYGWVYLDLHSTRNNGQKTLQFRIKANMLKTLELYIRTQESCTSEVT